VGATPADRVICAVVRINSMGAGWVAWPTYFTGQVDRAELMAKMRPMRVPHKLPVVLSRDEVARLIAAAANLKYQTALSVADGAGLRASEEAAGKYTFRARYTGTQQFQPSEGQVDLSCRTATGSTKRVTAAAITNSLHERANE
jgi:hypothetical protein